MNAGKSFPWWGVALGVGCLCIMVVGVLLAAGALYYYYHQTPAVAVQTVEPIAPPALPVLPEQPTLEESQPAPVPTSTPIPDQPESTLPLTGAQQLNDHYLFDDFSSDALHGGSMKMTLRL